MASLVCFFVVVCALPLMTQTNHFILQIYGKRAAPFIPFRTTVLIQFMESDFGKKLARHRDSGQLSAKSSNQFIPIFFEWANGRFRKFLLQCNLMGCIDEELNACSALSRAGFGKLLLNRYKHRDCCAYDVRTERMRTPPPDTRVICMGEFVKETMFIDLISGQSKPWVQCQFVYFRGNNRTNPRSARN